MIDLAPVILFHGVLNGVINRRYRVYRDCRKTSDNTCRVRPCVETYREHVNKPGDIKKYGQSVRNAVCDFFGHGIVYLWIFSAVYVDFDYVCASCQFHRSSLKSLVCVFAKQGVYRAVLQLNLFFCNYSRLTDADASRSKDARPLPSFMRL